MDAITKTGCCWPKRTSGLPTLLPYFGDGDEFQMSFNFPLMPRIFMAVRKEERKPIMDIINQLPKIPENCQWGIFLRNHDELTLEMVTDEERDYMYFEYATDKRMKINVGIRRRLAPLLENGRRRIELVNSLLFTLPGTPILYYGDEMGMGDNIYLGDRDGVRTPMQWTIDRNAGFSRADPARLYSPVIVRPGLRLPGYQRGGPGTDPFEPAALDEADDCHPQTLPGLWAGRHHLLQPDEPKGAGLYSRATATSKCSDRQQPVAVCPTGRTGFVGIQRAKRRSRLSARRLSRPLAICLTS